MIIIEQLIEQTGDFDFETPRDMLFFFFFYVNKNLWGDMGI